MGHDAPAIVELADRMLADIRKRRMSAGDPFWSAAEAAKKLRTSTTKANRALQLLERRLVLVRSQRKGSYIAAPVDDLSQPSIRRVNLVVAHNYLKTERLLADGVVVGIQAALPDADLQFRFIAESGDAEAVERIVAESLQSNEQEGFVLVRAPHEVQKAIVDSGLPAVIYGTGYPTLRATCSIDRDHREIGRLLATHLLQQGSRRILVLLRPLLLFGDNLLLDGLRMKLNEKQFASTELIVRCIPHDQDVVQEVIAQVANENDAPLGILCRSEPLADAAVAALPGRANRKRSGNIVGICAADFYPRAAEEPRWPCAKILLTPEKVGERIGQLLQSQVSGQLPNPTQAIIPVSLVEPVPKRSSRKKTAPVRRIRSPLPAQSTRKSRSA